MKHKKNFRFFSPHTLYMDHVSDSATSKTKSPQNTSKTLLKSLLEHKKQNKNFRFFSPHTLYMGHVTNLTTSKTKSPQNTSKTPLKSFLEHKKQIKNFRFFSPHTLFMDPHRSSTPTTELQGHMPPYYRRHKYYLIAIKHKKKQIKIIYPTGKSAAHKTCSFSPIPYTWDM